MTPLMKRFFLLLFFFASVACSTTAQINTDRMMLMGRTALQYEDYVLAIQRFNMVIGAKKWLPDPYFYRGVAKFYLEDYSGAEMDCTEAIKLNAYKFDYYYLRALCRSNQQRFSLAIEDYREAIRHNLMDRNCWYNLAASLINTKEYDQANQVVDSMMILWPREASQLSMKAQLQLCREDTLSASDWVEKALALDEYDGVALSLKALIQLHYDEFAEAEAGFDKAIIQRPREENLYSGRAIARYNQNNLRGAMSDYDQSLELNPDNFTAHYNRGLLRAQVGEDNKAIEDFNFVLQLDPEDIIALYNRALLYDNTGNYQAAIRDISTVIDEYPQFWAGYQQRAAIKRKIGDVAGAERDEFRLLKARMDASQGKLQLDKKPLKRRERHIEDHARLITEDEAPQYADLARGKVQNRRTELRIISGFRILSDEYTQHDPKTHNPVVNEEVLDLQMRLAELETSRTMMTAEEERLAYLKVAQDYRRLIEANPQNPDYYFDLGNAYAELHQYPQAYDAYTSALAIDDKFPEALYNRGVVLLLQEKKPEGLADLSKAGELGLYGAYNLIKRYSQQ